MWSIGQDKIINKQKKQNKTNKQKTYKTSNLKWSACLKILFFDKTPSLSWQPRQRCFVVTYSREFFFFTDFKVVSSWHRKLQLPHQKDLWSVQSRDQAHKVSLKYTSPIFWTWEAKFGLKWGIKSKTDIKKATTYSVPKPEWDQSWPNSMPAISKLSDTEKLLP